MSTGNGSRWVLGVAGLGLLSLGALGCPASDAPPSAAGKIESFSNDEITLSWTENGADAASSSDQFSECLMDWYGIDPPGGNGPLGAQFFFVSYETPFVHSVSTPSLMGTRTATEETGRLRIQLGHEEADTAFGPSPTDFLVDSGFYVCSPGNPDVQFLYSPDGDLDHPATVKSCIIQMAMGASQTSGAFQAIVEWHGETIQISDGEFFTTACGGNFQGYETTRAT